MEIETVKPFMIGIASNSVTAKNLIIYELLKILKFNAHIISQEWYNTNIGDEKLGIWEKQLSYDTKSAMQNIQAWKNGTGQFVQQYDNSIFIKPSPIMIFEGVIAFENVEISSLLDLKIYMEYDADIVLARYISSIAHNDDLESTIAVYEHNVKPVLDKSIRSSKLNADIVMYNVDENNIKNLKLMKLLQPYFESIGYMST